MKCYAVEEHLKKECPKSPNYKICSECSSLDHTWKTCNSEKKSVQTAAVPTEPLLTNVPREKKKIKEKEQKEKTEKNKTYSQAISSTSHTAPLALTTNNLDNNQISKIICFFHTHSLNLTNPGSLQRTLIDLLNIDKLPTVILPNNPPSQILQNIMHSGKDTINENCASTNLESDLQISLDSEDEDNGEEEEEEEEAH